IVRSEKVGVEVFLSAACRKILSGCSIVFSEASAPGEGIARPPFKGEAMVYLVENESGARIKVIGAGGCGGNAINHMIASGLRNIDFVSVNTDAQALLNNSAPSRMQI